MNITKIGMKTNAEMDAEVEEKEEMLGAIKRMAQYTDERGSLASHIKTVWESHRKHRLDIDRRLLYCLRTVKGEYSDQQMAAIQEEGGADPIFLPETGVKCRAAASWLRDTMIPAGDKPWGIEDTKEPQLPQELLRSIRAQTMRSVVEMVNSGMQITEDMVPVFEKSVQEEVKKLVKRQSSEAMKRMEVRIEDKMQEGGWEAALEEFINDVAVYPTAFLKGPYWTHKRALKWDKGVPKATVETTLSWRRVSPFDMYPAPYADCIQKGDLIERIRYYKSQLYDLIGMEGYSESDIRKVLQDHEYGSINEWIWEDFERDELETNSPFLGSDRDLIDALHYWGKVQGSILKEWGVTVPDEEKQYDIDAILIGNYVIRAVINDDILGQRPYHSACYDRIPGSIWGNAIPELMSSHQKMINASARALATNMAISSGPQIMVMSDMLAEGETMEGIRPMRIWQMHTSPLGSTQRPIEWYQPSSNSESLTNNIKFFKQEADDATNIPRYSYGNEKVGGAGSTATGLQTLMSSAAKGIRRAVANIDSGVIQPTVYQTFVTLMLEDPDKTIKGDVKVVPKGASAILIREQNLTKNLAFLQQLANPMIAEAVGKKNLIKTVSTIAKLQGLEMEFPSDDELDQMEKQEAEMMRQQQQAQIQQQQLANVDQSVAQQAQEEANMMQSQAQASTINQGQI